MNSDKIKHIYKLNKTNENFETVLKDLYNGKQDQMLECKKKRSFIKPILRVFNESKSLSNHLFKRIETNYTWFDSLLEQSRSNHLNYHQNIINIKMQLLKPCFIRLPSRLLLASLFFIIFLDYSFPCYFDIHFSTFQLHAFRRMCKILVKSQGVESSQPNLICLKLITRSKIQTILALDPSKIVHRIQTQLRVAIFTS